jgi:hypothetical protein
MASWDYGSFTHSGFRILNNKTSGEIGYVKSTPAGASTAGLLLLEADGSNWAATSYVLKLSTDDNDCYPLIITNGASQTFYVSRGGACNAASLDCGAGSIVGGNIASAAGYSFVRYTSNGGNIDCKAVTELLEITAGNGLAGVNTVGNLAPADALILGVTTRGTQAPGGGATIFDVGVTGGGNDDSLISDSAVALNTTAVTPGGNDNTQMPLANATATTLVLTTDANVVGASLIVRIALYYYSFTAQTS